MNWRGRCLRLVDRVILVDFILPYIDLFNHGIKGLDRVECVTCVQGSFLKQYIEGSTREAGPPPGE